ncbi:MAG: AAA family ATPase [Anaerovoracaceae bacterium]
METILEKTEAEVNKAVIGKAETVRKVLAVMIAGGHVLLDDIPGVGKTTLALAFSKALDLKFNRVQFTPDVVPSDITGFSVYDRKTGDFEYKPGAVMSNIFLADEINRTSSKTQSALLEVMQEGKVTVDGITHDVPQPFMVIATQNPVGTAGTQMLPEAQLDRFMVRLSIGYPDTDAQVKIMKDRRGRDPLDDVKPVIDAGDLMKIRKIASEIYIDDKIYMYITKLIEATREDPLIRLGVSPRGGIAIARLAQSWAMMNRRDYVVPEDVADIFNDTARHRIIMSPKAQMDGKSADDILSGILERVPLPDLMKKTGTDAAAGGSPEDRK